MALPFGGHYLDSLHTLENFKDELFFPRITDRRTWEQWYLDDALDMTQRARRRVEEIITGAKPVNGLPEANRKAVDAFAAEIFLQNGVDPEPLLY